MNICEVNISVSGEQLVIRAGANKIGSQYDNHVWTLNFIRPEGFEDYDLVLLFAAKQAYAPIILHQANEYAVPNALTQNLTLSMQVVLMRGGEERHSQIIQFEFRPSIRSADVPVEQLPDVAKTMALAFARVERDNGNVTFFNAQYKEVGAFDLPPPPEPVETAPASLVSGDEGNVLTTGADGKLYAPVSAPAPVEVLVYRSFEADDPENLRFTTIGAAISAMRGKDSVTFRLEKGAVFDEDVIIAEAFNWSFISEGTVLFPGATIRSMYVTGMATEITLAGIGIQRNLTVDSVFWFFIMRESYILGETQISPDIRSYYKIEFHNCSFQSSKFFTIAGEAEGFISLYGCSWRWEDQGAFVVNNPNASVFLRSCNDIAPHRKQGNLWDEGGCSFRPSPLVDPNYAIVSDDTPGEIIFGGASTTRDYDGERKPIKLAGTASYALGSLEFDEDNSILRGKKAPSGVGSSQVTDNAVRPGFTPRGDEGGGASAEGRTVPNTIKDALNGISDALVVRTKIRDSDEALTYSGEVDDDGSLHGGWKFELSNESTSGSIIIKNKFGEDWLNFDVSALAAAGLQAVVGITFNDPYWKPGHGFEAGAVVNYKERGYDVIAATTAGDTTPPDQDAAHYRTMGDWGLTIGRNIEPYSSLVVAVDGRVWTAKESTVVTQNTIDAFAAHTNHSPLVIDGVKWIAMQPSMPTTTPNDYLMFVLGDDSVTFANMSGFNLSGSQSIEIAGKKISVRLADGSGLQSTPAGLGWESDYGPYPKVDQTKLGALPTAAEMETTLMGKVDAVLGKGLSTNDFSDSQQAHLNALPTASELQSTYMKKSVENFSVGNKDGGWTPMEMLSVPMNEVVVNANLKVRASGNMVTLYAKLTSGSASDITVGTIPEKYRPEETIIWPYAMSGANGNPAQVWLKVTSAGVVSYNTQSISPITGTWNCLTYQLSNANAAHVMAPAGMFRLFDTPLAQAVSNNGDNTTVAAYLGWTTPRLALFNYVGSGSASIGGRAANTLQWVQPTDSIRINNNSSSTMISYGETISGGAYVIEKPAKKVGGVTVGSSVVWNGVLYKAGGWAHLVGQMTVSGTMSDGRVLLTLPDGFRPDATLFPSCARAGAGSGRTNLKADGTLTMQYYSTWAADMYSIDITFFAG